MADDEDWIEGEPEREKRAAEVAAVAGDLELQRRQRLALAYRRVFSAGHTDQDDVDAVLNDLMLFGRMFSTMLAARGQPEENWPIEVLEGRRQVALRINEHLQLPITTLYALYRKG